MFNSVLPFNKHTAKLSMFTELTFSSSNSLILWMLPPIDFLLAVPILLFIITLTVHYHMPLVITEHTPRLLLYAPDARVWLAGSGGPALFLAWHRSPQTRYHLSNTSSCCYTYISSNNSTSYHNLSKELFVFHKIIVYYLSKCS